MQHYSTYINTSKLKKELYYHPAWYTDEKKFLELLKQSKFKQEDITDFGRLYVKYSHLKDYEELNKYFKFILKRMKLNNEINLCHKTKQIYNIIMKNDTI